MTVWKINYFTSKIKKKSLEAWFDSLENEQFKSIAKELKLLELCGNTLQLPHSKALGNGLFELRERRFGLRVYYSFMPNNQIILITAGNKQTQRKDILYAIVQLHTMQKSKEQS